MKIVGLITEYNPFHNGHVYHLEKAKEITGADVCVAIMSGDFVQRGFPAITDKYARVRAALMCGVDAIFELPTYYATSSAERFAEGAVEILAGLGVDEIVYGCEGMDACDEGYNETFCEHDTTNFKKLANILCEEPEGYKESLKKYLSCGMNFPAARKKAISEIDESLATLLSSPNNILAIEYEKAVLRGGCKIKTQCILRNDEGYFESGTAIRKGLQSMECGKYLPEASIENIKYTVDVEDFAGLIFFKLSELSKEELEEYYEVTSEIATRIKKYEKDAEGGVEKLVELASAKNITGSAVRRSLIHVLLDIKKEDSQNLYGRLLGFNQCSGVMSEIKKRAGISLVTKFADGDTALTKIDCHASEVYNQIVSSARGVKLPDEYHAGVIII